MRIQGNWKIDSISKALLYIMAAGHILSYLSAVIPLLQVVLYYCMLSPSRILAGEVWRLVTWIIIPYGGGSDRGLFGFIWLVIMLYLRYWFSLMAEGILGRKYYLIYMLIGIALTDVFSFMAIPLQWMEVPSLFTMYYLNITVFLIMAVSYPNAPARFMFTLPMNMMILGIIDLGFILYDIVYFMMRGVPQILLATLPALLTFACLLVFPDVRSQQKVAPTKRQRQFKKSVKMAAPHGSTIHKCRICGRTEVSNPELEFRYCSKCLGNYEYCSEHLFTHEHVKG